MPTQVLTLTMLLLGCLISAPAIAAADQGEVRRQCREWADSMFARPTDAKAREFAKCIAERDPESAEARAGRQAEALEEAARVAAAAGARFRPSDSSVSVIRRRPWSGRWRNPTSSNAVPAMTATD